MSCERKGRCLVQEVPEKQSSGDDDRRQIPVIKEYRLADNYENRSKTGQESLRYTSRTRKFFDLSSLT